MNETNIASVWTPYEPGDDAPWILQRVVHLHRRAGFAAPWDVLQRDLADGPKVAVGRFLQGGKQDDSTSEFETMARTIGDAAMASGSPGRLKAWWLYRMLLSPDPLGERLTLMWHNHFATSNRKVQDLVRMREQNELFREHARDPFATLLGAVVKHPAMLTWLDAESNRKGHPNENLARELMELFTLGVGNYSEDDVKEAARALTGWTIVGGNFGFREARHDDEPKTMFGTRDIVTGDELLAILVDQPATAQRLAWRLCQTFLGENVVDDHALTQLAEGLATHDLDIGWGVETILRSNLFFSAENLRSRVSGPVEYLVGALRALELCEPPPSTLLLAEWSSRMGQDLFYPPNVGGWNEGRTWLGSRTIIARANFAETLAQGQLWHPALVPDFEQLLNRHDVGVDLESRATWIATLLRGKATAAVVEQVVAQAHSTHSPKLLSSVVVALLAQPEYQLA